MRMIVLAAASLLVFAVPALADDENQGGAMGQLENATSGHQDLDQTYGDSNHSPGCPDACPTNDSAGNVPEPPPPTPVDDGQN